MFGKRKKNAAENKRSTRSRKVSQRMAVVDDSTRKQVAAARLEAFENDNQQEDAFGLDSDDDEFMVESEEEELEFGKKSKKGKAAGKKRKTRVTGATDRRGPKTFAMLLEEADVPDPKAPAGAPTPAQLYLSAAAAPSKTSAARKFCSVCGNSAPYTCARCGSKFCCRKCYGVHTETRCLKFMA